MIVTSRAKGFICTTAHPAGCRENVLSQIAYAKGKAEDYHKKAEWPVKNVLVIGCSTGYGLASRIAAAFTAGCNTLGIMYEREAARQDGLYAETINDEYAELEAYVCVNKAVVTQSSAAIPGVPLYLSALYRVMKEMGLHEDCAMQMARLFTDRLCAKKPDTDTQGRIRMDDWELKAEVQKRLCRSGMRLQQKTKRNFVILTAIGKISIKCLDLA